MRGGSAVASGRDQRVGSVADAGPAPGTDRSGIGADATDVRLFVVAVGRLVGVNVGHGTVLVEVLVDQVRGDHLVGVARVAWESVLSGPEHGHLHCRVRGGGEIKPDEGAAIVVSLEAAPAFAVDRSRVTIV